jgi:hypothetical protein
MAFEATCSCIKCDACGGSGNIWLDRRGRYLGQHRCDDLDEMETCDNCRGYGITDLCETCSDSYEDEDY